jgi:hypothetical protein
MHGRGERVGVGDPFCTNARERRRRCSEEVEYYRKLGRRIKDLRKEGPTHL